MFTAYLIVNIIGTLFIDTSFRTAIANNRNKHAVAVLIVGYLLWFPLFVFDEVKNGR